MRKDIAPNNSGMLKKLGQLMAGGNADVVEAIDSLSRRQEQEAAKIEQDDKKAEIAQRVKDRVAEKSTSGPSSTRTGLVSTLVSSFGVSGEIGDKVSGFLNDGITKAMNAPMRAISEKSAEFSIRMGDASKAALQSTKDFLTPKKPKKGPLLTPEKKKELKLKKQQQKKEIKVLTTGVEDSFPPAVKEIKDEFLDVAEGMRKIMKKAGGKSKSAKGGLSTALVARSILTGTVIGTTIIPALMALGPMLLAGIGVAVAGATGAAIGTALNEKIDSTVTELTGGKSKTLGEAVYNLFHGTPDPKKEDAEVYAIREKGLLRRGFSKEEAKKIARASNYAIISRAGPEAFRAGKSTTPAIKQNDSSSEKNTRKLPKDSKLTGGSKFEGEIQSAAKEFNVDPADIRAIIKQESNFNPKAQSKAGAQGLMQLMPNTAKSVGVKDSFDPAQNIRGGTEYYSQLLERFKDPRLAKAAYNAGPTKVAQVIKEVGNDPDAVLKKLGYKETTDYVDKVSSYKKSQIIKQGSAPYIKSTQAVAKPAPLQVSKPIVAKAATPAPPPATQAASSNKTTRIDDMGILLANSMLYQ